VIHQPGIYYIISRFAIAFTCLSVLASFELSAISLYKWVDAEGNVSYQDSLPLKGQVFEEKSISDNVPASNQTTNDGGQLSVSFYVSNDCSRCEAVRTILEMNKVPYNQYLTDFNQDIQQQLLEISGSTRVPAVVIGERVIDKLDRRNLESALRLSGYNKPALIEE